ncbi:hypothetical protein DACRYDRAFT_21215, partial [Dacryopinax primogenitus]
MHTISPPMPKDRHLAHSLRRRRMRPLSRERNCLRHPPTPLPRVGYPLPPGSRTPALSIHQQHS